MSSRKLDRILDKLAEIGGRLEKLEKLKRKRNLPFEACIPPLHICKELVDTRYVGLFGKWDFQMQILSDYYDIKPMGNYHNPEMVPPKSIACYHPFDGDAYYKSPQADLETVLHEFFHHLDANGVVDKDGEDAEKLANRYAKIIIERGESK